MLKVLDLFSGIGGFSLGLERTGGFETVAFCEIDKKCQLVLSKHWPKIPIFEDVKDLTCKSIQNIDVIAGGFPCQDISIAGTRLGLKGSRSSLWYEFYRLIKEFKPKYAIIENVSALRSNGLLEIIKMLAEVGYDAEWHTIPAIAVGAPHKRERVWIVAFPSGKRLEVFKFFTINREAIGIGEEWISRPTSKCGGLQVQNHWRFEPNVGRMANGIPGRVDRLKQLGNSVVPQIIELIGCAILQREAALK